MLSLSIMYTARKRNAVNLLLRAYSYVFRAVNTEPILRFTAVS